VFLGLGVAILPHVGDRGSDEQGAPSRCRINAENVEDSVGDGHGRGPFAILQIANRPLADADRVGKTLQGVPAAHPFGAEDLSEPPVEGVALSIGVNHG